MYVLLVKDKETMRAYKKIIHKITKKDTDCTFIKIKKQHKKIYIVDTSPPSSVFREVESIIQDIEKKIDAFIGNT